MREKKRREEEEEEVKRKEKGRSTGEGDKPCGDLLLGPWSKTLSPSGLGVVRS